MTPDERKRDKNARRHYAKQAMADKHKRDQAARGDYVQYRSRLHMTPEELGYWMSMSTEERLSMSPEKRAAHDQFWSVKYRQAMNEAEAQADADSRWWVDEQVYNRLLDREAEAARKRRRRLRDAITAALRSFRR